MPRNQTSTPGTSVPLVTLVKDKLGTHVVLTALVYVFRCLLARMFRRSKNIKYFLSLVPGKHRLGTYRFLPIFFCIGGVMEWIMINVRIGKETFYDVYRRKQSEREYQRRIADGPVVLDEPAAK
ncbi:hypothetical protein JOB18_020816 [Solea senegalensis]|uniref:Small integral membrane protein 4 n=1 Tax=Solea senegalensis TaxID=28829 RepID=A0AAV6SQU9_SOLSE|nr:small integral membrane protein 4 [Solea senegalensis]KAG7520001.1 small integral membrane protein 4 [Solea senegalensis]KAG7520002.1 hypothetical protein JOB18_020816 [Solea senegalensis]